MRNISNKIRFVAFLMVMLLSTINIGAYRVQFRLNGVNVCPAVNTTEEFVLPKSTQSGEVVTGWYTNSNVYYLAGEKYTPTADIILKADMEDADIPVLGISVKMIN